MKYIVLMCLLALLTGCTSQKKSIYQFTEQFQQADSAFNKQYRKEESYGKLLR